MENCIHLRIYFYFKTLDSVLFVRYTCIITKFIFICLYINFVQVYLHSRIISEDNNDIMSSDRKEITGWLKSSFSHQEIALLAQNLFSQVNTSVVSTHAKLQVILSINSLFTSHLKLTCQSIFLIWKKLNIAQ